MMRVLKDFLKKIIIITYDKDKVQKKLSVTVSRYDCVTFFFKGL